MPSRSGRLNIENLEIGFNAEENRSKQYLFDKGIIVLSFNAAGDWVRVDNRCATFLDLKLDSGQAMRLRVSIDLTSKLVSWESIHSTGRKKVSGTVPIPKHLEDKRWYPYVGAWSSNCFEMLLL